MTPQEAITELLTDKLCLMVVASHPSLVNVEEIGIAISALEKQIPKRINEYNRCPCCDPYNETIEKRKRTVKSDTCYCWHCGQALDWSDTE